MEKIITCSKILYDKIISEKMNEIYDLKKKQLSNTSPKVLYNNYDEWINAKNTIYKNIKNSIIEYVNHNSDVNYNYITYESLPLVGVIENAINYLTKNKNKNWVYKISFNISYGLEGLITGLKVSKIIYDINKHKLIELIYENIIWQLEDDHYPCILEDVLLLKCIKCNKISDCVGESNICDNCIDSLLLYM